MIRNLALALPLVAIVALIYDWSRPPTTPGAAPRSYPEVVAGKSRVQSSYDGALTGQALESYSEWSRSPKHFGAFAVSEFGYYGWVSSYNDPAFAEAAAMAFCGSPDCRVIARSRPLASPGPDERALSERAMQFYFNYLQMDGPKAFAAAPNGGTGWWGNARTRSAAEVKARAACETHKLKGDLPDGLDQPGCEIVHSAGF